MKRTFECDGAVWAVWTSGTGACGTGIHGLGFVEAIHFARADTPDVPELEALVGKCEIDALFDEELVRLFRTARRVVDPSAVPQRPVNRRGAGLS